MREILQQVLNVPGAIGALAFDARGTILASEFPEQYESTTLQAMVQRLADDFMVRQSLEGETGGLELRYTGGRILLRPFSRGTVLALCSVAANARVVGLALMQAVHRMDLDAPPARPAPVVPPIAASPLSALPPEAMKALKRVFLDCVGPIGELLFTKIYAAWAAEGGRPAELVQAIAAEIEDSADKKAFFRDARTIIG